jgi:hypothetical protein
MFLVVPGFEAKDLWPWYAKFTNSFTWYGSPWQWLQQTPAKADVLYKLRVVRVVLQGKCGVADLEMK